jgi:SAM-dependent methyltransferase
VEDNSVDIVISNHALEHVPHPLSALREIRSKLVCGGRLMLCLPFDDWRTQAHYVPDDINHHLYTWSPLLLGNLLNEAQFVVEEARVYTHAWPPRWRWLDAHLPVGLFDAVCTYYAWRMNRRQVFVRVSKP